MSDLRLGLGFGSGLLLKIWLKFNTVQGNGWISFHFETCIQHFIICLLVVSVF